MTNCPRCNMYLAPGAQICPNCQLNLNQYMYQQQQQSYYTHPVPSSPETPRELKYRKVLVMIAIVVMAEFALTSALGMFGIYSFARIFNLLSSLIWMAAPLLIALMLPKEFSGRNILLTFASIYIAARLIYVAWTFAMFGGYYPGGF